MGQSVFWPPLDRVDRSRSRPKKHRSAGCNSGRLDQECSGIPSARKVEKFVEAMQSLGASARVAGKSLAIDYGPNAVRVAYVKPNGRLAFAAWQLAKVHRFSSEKSGLELFDKLESRAFALSNRNATGEPTLELPSPSDEQRWESLQEFFSDLFEELSTEASV